MRGMDPPCARSSADMAGLMEEERGEKRSHVVGAEMISSRQRTSLATASAMSMVQPIVMPWRSGA